MVTREYCEKIICQQIRYYRLYENFLERRKLPKLTQEEIEHVNRSISTKEPWVSYRLSLKKKKKIPTKESPEPKSFTGELYQMFKEELTMFHKLLKKKKKKEEGTIPKSLDEARFALIWKTKASQEKNITKHFLWLCIQKSSIKY